jgi:hypothetical protein
MADDSAQREVLPIPDRRPVGLTTFEATDPDTAYPPIRPLRPPADAPNVLVVLLDDVGFGASSAFGGPCNTPTAERLAAEGLKYTRFHTRRCARRQRRSQSWGRRPLPPEAAPAVSGTRVQTMHFLGGPGEGTIEAARVPYRTAE